MPLVLLACGRAFMSLFRPGVLWHLMWPTLLSALVWITLGAFFIDELSAAVTGFLPGLPLIGHWFGEGSSVASHAASGLFTLLLWLLVLPLIYVSALLLISSIALPMMLERVGEREYPELERRAGGSQWGSLATSLKAACLFILPFVLCLPLWFIPGAGLVVTVLLSARLNRVCFTYDSLMNHADVIELERLPREHQGRLNMLALGGGILALVPVVNLLAPALSGLCFVHYLLEALRRERKRPLHDVVVEPAGIPLP